MHLQLHSINGCFLMTSGCTTVFRLYIFSLNEKLADRFIVPRDPLMNPLHTDKKIGRISDNLSEYSLVKNAFAFSLLNLKPSYMWITTGDKPFLK